MKTLEAKQKEFLLQSIREVPDYPKPGIIFQDISTLLNNKKAFGLLMEHLSEYYQNSPIDFIAGIESRGFIFGSALATRLDLPFVPIRKPGKLPFTTIKEKYSLEYGFDEIEIHIDAFSTNERKNVLLIDDLIATGGTAKAAVNLIEKIGAKCFEACFIINLEFLDGLEQVKKLTNTYCVLDIKGL